MEKKTKRLIEMEGLGLCLQKQHRCLIWNSQAMCAPSSKELLSTKSLDKLLHP